MIKKDIEKVSGGSKLELTNDEMPDSGTGTFVIRDNKNNRITEFPYQGGRKKAKAKSQAFTFMKQHDESI